MIMILRTFNKADKMKQIQFLLYVILSIAAISCSKQELVEQNTNEERETVNTPFYLYAELPESKVTFTTESNKLHPTWEKATDKVIGFDDSGTTYTFSIASIDENGKATFKSDGASPASGSNLHLIYAPGYSASDIVNKTLKVSFKRQLSPVPAIMLADGTVTGDSVTVQFRNACAIFGVETSVGTEMAGKGIARIILEGQNMSEGTVSLSGNKLVLTPTTTSTETVRRDFETVAVDGSGNIASPIYIAVPAGAKVDYITVNDGSNHLFRYTPSTVNTTNKYYRVKGKTFSAYTEVTPESEGALGGIFTITYTGDDGNNYQEKIRFSKGNLQYQASTNTWRFAEHQWDFVGSAKKGSTYAGNVEGSDNMDASSTYDGWIDLFGWGTTGINYRPWTNDSPKYQPWTNETSSDDIKNNASNYGPYGNNVNLLVHNGSDWGFNIGDYYIWRTMSKYEWNALLKDNNKWASVKINFSKALSSIILLPDEYEDPKKNSSSYAKKNDYKVYTEANDGNTTKNVYTEDGWGEMEKSNVILISPPKVYRTYSIQSGGKYWSSNSSSVDIKKAQDITVSSTSITINDVACSRAYSQTVRLVMTVDGPTLVE